MMQKNGLLQHFLMDRELDGDSFPWKSLIEILEDSRVLIENHHGVKEYGNCCICVMLKFGHAEIIGESLEVNRMTREQLVITGKIRCVTLHRRGA